MKRTFWILGSFLILAAMLRFFQLDAQSFWNDEGTSARVAERSLPLITAAAIGDIHPPLYYYVLHFWRMVAGSSEWGLRSFSAALGVLLVWLIYRLGRDVYDEATGLAAAGVAAMNPFQVYYSQEARMYILLAVLAAISSYLLIRCIQALDSTPNDGPITGVKEIRWLAVGYTLASAAGMYTHYAFPFVLAAQNLIVAGWLIWKRVDWRRRLAGWAALQAAVGVLYLPWLGVALARLPEWKAPAPPYQLEPALLDTLRWFVFGRTIPTAPVTLALGVAGLFLLVSFIPGRTQSPAPGRKEDIAASNETRQAVRPSFWRSALDTLPSTLLFWAWWLVPVVLIFALGLYKESYLKFLLAASAPFCVLFGRGIMNSWRMASRVVIFQELKSGPGSPAQFWQTVVILLLIFIAMFTVQSLSNLYFDPAYAREDYRSIAKRIQSQARPGDAILLEAPNQWETFTYYYGDRPNVKPLSRVRPVTEQAAAEELKPIAAEYSRMFVLYWAETEPDPNRYVERWLDANLYKATEDWYGTVRLAVYAVPATVSDAPQHTLDTLFENSIRLLGYSLLTNAIAPGDIAQMALFWQAQAPIGNRYKLFVHILGADDRPVAQVDREPGGGLVPTTIWKPGQTITDRYGILIPKSLPPGRYRVAVGLYGFDNVRLRSGSGDQVILSEIQVK